MIVAAKCEVIGFALDKMNAAKWGLFCKDRSCNIVSHYISYLKCPTVVNLKPEGIFGCIDNTIVFNCNFNVLRTSLNIQQTQLIFSFQVGDIVGGKSPFTYKWIYDTEDFIASGPIDQAELILSLRSGKNLLSLVSKIIMQVTDADKCFDEKICWLVNGSLTCYNNYVACPNPDNLIVTNKTNRCIAPSGLIVSIK